MTHHKKCTNARERPVPVRQSIFAHSILPPDHRGSHSSSYRRPGTSLAQHTTQRSAQAAVPDWLLRDSRALTPTDHDPRTPPQIHALAPYKSQLPCRNEQPDRTPTTGWRHFLREDSTHGSSPCHSNVPRVVKPWVPNMLSQLRGSRSSTHKRFPQERSIVWSNRISQSSSVGDRCVRSAYGPNRCRLQRCSHV
jgi:hypothetical protein